MAFVIKIIWVGVTIFLIYLGFGQGIYSTFWPIVKGKMLYSSVHGKFVVGT